jgi:hypothetical protein
MFVACTKKSDPVVNPVVNPVVTVPVVVNPTSAPVINKNTIIYNNNKYDNLGPYNLQLLSNTTSAGFVMAGIFGNHYMRVVFPKGKPTVSMTIPMTKTSTDLQTDFQLDLYQTQILNSLIHFDKYFIKKTQKNLVHPLCVSGRGFV